MADSNALRSVLAVFGFKVDDKELESADKKIEGFMQKAAVVGKALVGGAIAVGIFKFGQSLADTGDHLRDTSIRLGISTDAVQELGFAAEQSGAGIENLSTGLLILQDKIGDALINASGEGAKAFKKYGIAIRDASGHVKAADQLFADVADKIADTKDEAKQVTIATDLFGKQGRVLLPLLKEGADGLREMRNEARELGEGFSKEATEASDDFNDSLGRLNRVVQTARGRIATVLLPVLTWLVDKVTKAGAVFLDLAKNSSIVQTILGGLGIVVAALAVKMAIAFAPFLAAVAGFAALVILVEDVVTLFRGGKSVVGDFIDSLFGVGSAAQAVRAVKDAIEGVAQAFKDTIRSGQLFKKFVSSGFSTKDFNKEDLKDFARISGNRGLQDEVAGLTFDREAFNRNLRLQAAKKGNVVRFPGESREQAQVATQESLFFGPAAPVVGAPAAGGSTVSNSLDLTINVPPGTGREQADQIGRVVEQKWNEMTRGVQQLTPAVPK